MIKDQQRVSDILNDVYINVTSHTSVPNAIIENDFVSEILEHLCNHLYIEFIRNNVRILNTIMFHLVPEG